jgi:hypothetical protein
MPYLLSLDLSIACTGYCVFDIETNKLIEHGIVPVKKATKKKFKGLYNIGVEEEEYRDFKCDQEIYDYISNALLTKLQDYVNDIEWVVREGYGFGGASLSRLAEQSGVCTHKLWQHFPLPFQRLITVAPPSVKKIACGKGKATKKEVMEGVSERFGVAVDYWYSNDDCDAFVIGKIGLTVVNNNCRTKYEKELRQKIIKNNNLDLE